MPKTATGKILNQKELSETFGVTPQTIRNWVKRGCPVHLDEGRGKATQFNSAQVFAWRERCLQAALEEQVPEKDRVRIRRDAAAADLAEIEVEKQRGALVPIDMVVGEVAKEYAMIRANFLAMSGEIADELEMQELPFIEEKLSLKIGEILNALAFDSKAEP
ncbi:terminase small subunit [Polycladidibacter hongkongensis]|uniref:terminase small subunit n=1 Tax=Polycladidibacter hongkongensis TaxID=1647556 RepID=UPI00082EDA2B|nr:terminase small subunit [Pseudovibrio hongkongensis]